MTHQVFRSRFAHHRLDAYQVALELFERVEAVARGFPRGHADLKDQLRRAAAATVRHIAEGANRIHPRDKSARFTLARAECGECEAAIEMSRIIGLIPEDQCSSLRGLADRIAAMTMGLIRRELQRMRTGSATRFRADPGPPSAPRV